MANTLSHSTWIDYTKNIKQDPYNKIDCSLNKIRRYWPNLFAPETVQTKFSTQSCNFQFR